jgi:hypothetical protein
VNRAIMTENSDLATRDVSNWTRVDEQSNSNPRFHAGIYNVDGRFVAVNRSAPENSLEHLNADQARRLFQNVPFRLHAERGVTDRLQGEIWRVFVTLMLLFLIAEGILILPTSGPAPARASTPTRKPAEVAA